MTSFFFLAFTFENCLILPVQLRFRKKMFFLYTNAKKNHRQFLFSNFCQNNQEESRQKLPHLITTEK